MLKGFSFSHFQEEQRNLFLGFYFLFTGGGDRHGMTKQALQHLRFILKCFPSWLPHLCMYDSIENRCCAPMHVCTCLHTYTVLAFSNRTDCEADPPEHREDLFFVLLWVVRLQPDQVLRPNHCLEFFGGSIFI
jgi:hypothetical protein